MTDWCDTVLIDLSQYSDSQLRGNALFNAVLLMLKYFGSDELSDRLPGIVRLLVQIIDEPRGLECLKALLVYFSSSGIFFMRILLFAVNFLTTLTLWLSGASPIAQQRAGDTPSQRILPLPERELSNSQTQMELLKRLRSLVAGHEAPAKDDAANPEDTPNSKNAPAIDEQQLEQLQQALKKLQDQLPPGIKPPELDSIPKEQLDRAMSDPAVQQQMKKMLEQFSKDGLLPKADNGGNKSQMPPMPQRPPMSRPNAQLPKPAELRSPFDPPPSLEPRFPAEPESAPRQGPQGDQDSLTPDAKEPQSKPAEKSWQSLKDAMKKLADIAQGQKKSKQNSQQNDVDEKSPDSAEMQDNPKVLGTSEMKQSEPSPKNPAAGRSGSNPGSPQSGGNGRNKSIVPPSPSDNTSNPPNDNNPPSGTPTPGNPPTLDVPAQGDSEQKEQSLKTLQDLLERFKNSQRDQPVELPDKGNGSQSKNDNMPSGNRTRDDSMPPAMEPVSPRQQNQNSPGIPSSPVSDPSKRVLRRPDRSSPVIPPGTESRPSQRSQPSQKGEVFPLRPVPPREVTPQSSSAPQSQAQPPNFKPDQFEPPTKQSTPESSESESSGLFPSISEFIKEQMRDGFPTPGSGDSVAKSNTPPPNTPAPKIQSRNMNPGASQSRGAGSREASNSNPGSTADARNGSPAPGVREIDTNSQPRDLDVRKELENRGLRGTFEKIVQKAKEESRAKQQQEAVAGQPGIAPLPQGKNTNPAIPLNDAKSPSDLGLQKSLGDLLSGLDDNLPDIAKDAKFNEPPSNNSRVQDSRWQSQPPKSDSSLGKIRDAASGFFSDLSQAPQAPAAPLSSNSGAGGSALSTDAPFAIGSFFFVACVLMGVVGLVAYLMRKPLMKLVTDATGVTTGHSALQPNEIRSRADVIAAFHDLALNPRQAVESWWTHQAAAQKLAAESPHSKQAVNTLAEIYEQARYLPDDVELPADKIQSARTALAECR